MITAIVTIYQQEGRTILATMVVSDGTSKIYRPEKMSKTEFIDKLTLDLFAKKIFNYEIYTTTVENIQKYHAVESN